MLVSFMYSNAQSLDGIKDQQPILINGSISTNQTFNNQPNDSSSHFLYNSYYTGSLTLTTFGIATPITFNYSNKKSNLSHPFNQYGIHPSYKWAKAHIGYASMSFSPYTLNGHLFLGAGAEFDPPGKLKGSVMYGRLQKHLNYDTINNASSYKRMGYGIKIGIEDNGNNIFLSMFNAKDIIESITSNPKNSLPEENSVMSISFNQNIAKKISFSGEIASSYLTTDITSDDFELSQTAIKPASWFIQNRESTIHRKAINSRLSYNHKHFTMGLGYERVDPEYRTLGAYYFNNNLENTTIQFSTNLFQNKISFSANSGLQKDNLDKNKLNNTKRFVGSANVNILPIEKLSLSLSYSNFASYTNTRSTFDYINETLPYQNYDTLNYRQVSQTTNFKRSQPINKYKYNMATIKRYSKLRLY